MCSAAGHSRRVARMVRAGGDWPTLVARDRASSDVLYTGAVQRTGFGSVHLFPILMSRQMMRRPGTYAVLALLVLCLLVILKRRREPASPPRDEHSTNMIRVADSRATTRLVKGFYETDNPYWRWTGREFSVILNPPKGATQNGAVLVLRYAIVEGVLESLKTMDLSIAVDGVALPRQHYNKPGQFTLRLEVPAEALRFDTVRVDFMLDKALPPAGREVRELGIIVSEVGVEAR